MKFWLLTLAYSVVAVAVVRWTLISALGFWICTPQYFVKYPTVYKLLPLVLLVVTAVVGLASGVPWYVVVIVLLVVRTISLWFGKKLAFAKYRKEVVDVLDTDPEELKAASQQTDKELWELAKLAMKHEI